MNSTSTAHQILSGLFEEHTGTKPLQIQPITGSGSQRKYYRLSGKGFSYVGTVSSNIAENESFFHVASVFEKNGIPVPEIISISKDRQAYLQSDLGNVSLLDLVERSWLQGSFHPSLLDFYREAIEKLLQIQFVAGKKINFSKCYPEDRFSVMSIREDLNYFRYYFLKLHNIDFNESRLNKLFDRFARNINSRGNAAFMYRDFQARNIMVHMGKLCFIDFQGGRKGPALYDLASLLYQAKARIPDNFRRLLSDHYLNLAATNGMISRDEADEQYNMLVYLRLMQVLGAYGFRGLIQKKSHFIESIPYTLDELKKLLIKTPLNIEFDELNQLLQQTASVQDQYIKPAGARNNSLIVRVNSFSYRKGGIPDDESGNGGGFVFDCRPLPNPGRDIRFKSLTGLDEEVKNLLGSNQEVVQYLTNVYALLEQTLINYSERNFSDLMISFGCTGGQHRSVFCAEQTALFLQKKFPDIEIIVRHPELKDLYFNKL
jgi:aminoglycoside/choline kinase family phosphotransferase